MDVKGIRSESESMRGRLSRCIEKRSMPAYRSRRLGRQSRRNCDTKSQRTTVRKASRARAPATRVCLADARRGHGPRRLQPQRQLDGQSPADKRRFGITGVCEIKPQDFRSLLGQGLYPSLLGFNRATESFSHFTVEIIATHYTDSRRHRVSR
jgi:hypothetical protein